jgi:hypothetical protein
VAVVEQFGRPRAELTVARFSAPAPPPLTRPRGVRASRHANRLHLRWRFVPGAAAYTVRARTSDHHSVATTVASPRFTLLLSRGSSARFTIRAVTARSAGPPTRLNVHTVPH